MEAKLMHEVTLVEPPRFSREMRQAIGLRRKKCTTRGRKLGEVGDRWPLDGEVYEYTSIDQHPLFYVANAFYREEGFASPGDFRDAWCRYHRMKPSSHPEDHPYWNQKKWTHWFDPVEEAEA